MGYTPSIYFPTGKYFFTKTITIDHRPVHIYGDNGTVFSSFSSKLTFAAGQTGFMISRSGTSTQETILERLLIVPAGKTAAMADGIAECTRISLHDIKVKGFSNNVIGFWVNMEEENDASGSLVEKCHRLDNGNHGFFLGRTGAILLRSWLAMRGTMGAMTSTTIVSWAISVKCPTTTRPVTFCAR